MAWIVDTCVLLDVLEADPQFGGASATTLDGLLGDGLIVCPVTYVELAPAFECSSVLQDEFLAAAGVGWREPWTVADTATAHAAWGRFVRRRRRDGLPRRPIADVLIGAYASRFSGLVTRNAADFRALFPGLSIRVPGE